MKKTALIPILNVIDIWKELDKYPGFLEKPFNHEIQVYWNCYVKQKLQQFLQMPPKELETKWESNLNSPDEEFENLISSTLKEQYRSVTDETRDIKAFFELYRCCDNLGILVLWWDHRWWFKDPQDQVLFMLKWSNT